jgi:hypothetical protein
VLFTDSADKATRFIWLCDAYSIPLIYLADVPGFMIGSEVERGGIIRHGAKMVSAVSSATVPQFCVVVRKAYGAGLYAMGGPGFGPDATIALPTARIAVMGPEAAVNAVYANKIAEVEAAEVPRVTPSSLLDGRSTRGRRPRAARGRPGHRPGRRGRPSCATNCSLRLRMPRRRDRHFATKRRGIPPSRSARLAHFSLLVRRSRARMRGRRRSASGRQSRQRPGGTRAVPRWRARR